MTEPEVSVIIPAYNSGAFIKKALDSALEQKGVRLEVIVVDDGSVDDTEQIMQEYHTCRYFKKENGGPASARNFGIQMAKGKYIAFLDADDMWLEGKIERQVKLLTEDNYDLVYSETTTIDENDDICPKKCMTKRYNGYLFKYLFLKNFIPISSVIVRSECFKFVGVFNEDKDYISVEDYDMWLRISAEYKIGYIDAPLTLYRLHKDGISKDINRSYLGEEGVVLDNYNRYKKKYEWLPGVFKKRLSELYYAHGYELYYFHHYISAHKKFLKSIKHNYLNLKSWFYFIATIFHPSIVRMIRDFKHKLNKE